MTGICEFIRSLGVMTDSDEADPAWFAVDFNNVILGDPYLDGTGWFPDKETAMGIANIVLPILNVQALQALEDNPRLGEVWTDAEDEAQRSWCYLISAEKDSNDSPVVEEQYEGDVWFVVSVELDMLSPEQREMLDKIRAELSKVSQ